MSDNTPSPAATAAAAIGAGAEAFEWDVLDGRLLPTSYVPASWHGTLPLDAQGRLGFGFRLETGEVLRLSLDAEGARHLAESVAEYLRGHALRPAPEDRAGPSPALSNRG